MSNPSYYLGLESNYDIKSLNSKDLPLNNLIESEREVLLILHKRNDIIIRKADKGGVVVIVDVKGNAQFIFLCNPQKSGASRVCITFL